MFTTSWWKHMSVSLSRRAAKLRRDLKTLTRSRPFPWTSRFVCAFFDCMVQIFAFVWTIVWFLLKPDVVSCRFFLCVDFIRQNTQIQTCFFVFGIMFSWRSVWLRQVNRRLIPLSLSHCKCYIHVPKSTEQQQLLPLYGFSFKAGALLHGALVSQGLVPPCG